MRFLVSVEPDWEAANRLDSQPGGPDPFFAHVTEQFHPEAFYVESGRRKAWWVIDFESAAAMKEFSHLCIWHAGAYPVVVPVMTGAEAAKTIPEAAAKAQALSW